MTDRRSIRLRGLAIAVAMLYATLMAPLAGTAAAAVDDVPTVRVKIRAISLDGYTGNIVVAARVRCTEKVAGVGSASWNVKAVQELRARAGAAIKCDGVARRSVLQLDSKHGRFHPGTVDLTVEQTAVGSRRVEIQSSSFSTTV
ncbi:MAG: hypothetical protein ACJ74E_01665 [Actinomycetes bacterium]